MEDRILQKLTEIFQRLPGIGPRQARRFSYALLEEKDETIEALAGMLLKLKNKVKRCARCFRVFEDGRGEECDICCVPGRDKSTLLVIEKDIDLENMEKAGVYQGLYHVLGGVISPLKPESQKNLRLKELYNRAEKENLKEIIIAFSANTEGDATAIYIWRILEPLLEKKKIRLTRLGRGLSTGAELEYSDRNTLKNALENRK